jgi:hypothetical protein
MTFHKILAGAAILLLSLGLANADAVPIAAGSVFNITGSSHFDATRITFSNPEAVTTGTGSFLAFGTCSTCATMTSPLIYAPFTAGLVYTATQGGLTSTFTITSQIDAPVRTGLTLSIHDAGFATLTGFDTTPGEWVFTANQFGDIVGSFSATSFAVPEPFSLGILGLGVFCLGLVKRSRSAIA